MKCQFMVAIIRVRPCLVAGRLALCAVASAHRRDTSAQALMLSLRVSLLFYNHNYGLYMSGSFAFEMKMSGKVSPSLRLQSYVSYIQKHDTLFAFRSETKLLIETRGGPSSVLSKGLLALRAGVVSPRTSPPCCRLPTVGSRVLGSTTCTVRSRRTMRSWSPTSHCHARSTRCRRSW